LKNYPLITIVTPTYNQGIFISDTFDSIRKEKQSGTEIQYIVFNANSTDNTEDVVQCNRDIIDLYVNEKDNGQAHAVNKGLSIANGKYFNWLNSDDFYLPKTLSLLNCFKEENYDIISFLNLFSFEDGGIFNGWGERGRSNWQAEYLDIFKGTIIFGQESTFIRTEFIRENNIQLLENNKTSFDHLFYETLLRHEPKILLVNYCGGVMRLHGESITIKGKSKEDYQEQQKAVKNIIGRKGILLKKLFHNKYTKWIFKIYIYFIRNGINISFLKIYKIKKIDVCHNTKFNTLKRENWKIDNLYESNN
jgi:glycosyltransferase involved in cell wall biosynthesis